MEVAIVGVGISCATGLCAKQAASSARAGISRLEETKWIGKDGRPLKMARVPNDVLPPLDPEIEADRSLTQWESRMIRLGAVALEEALAAAGRLPWQFH